jgi:hypothetical protein
MQPTALDLTYYLFNVAANTNDAEKKYKTTYLNFSPGIYKDI